MKHFFSLTVVLLLSTVSLPAAVRLPALIGKNMVLQRQIPCRIWGWADPGEEVSVALNGQVKKSQAEADGKWSVILDPQEAGGPFTMIVKGRNELTLENVMVGEVWIASGQSNMYWSVEKSNHGITEVARADFPDLRLISVPTRAEKTPQDDFQGEWDICTPKTVPGFSAVAYFFGRDIHRKLKIPVGLIHCSWGGSACEAWINPDVIARHPEYATLVERRLQFEKKPTSRGINKQAGHLYHGMLRPVIGYGIRGAVWYQGEANAARAHQYRTLFPRMIENWRNEWKQGDFPFYWAQLANFRETKIHPEPSSWAELREAQSMTRSLDNTGEAVIIDLGDPKDIHPRNKQDVGGRLALLALNRTYGRVTACESPRFRSISFAEGKATLRFDFVEDGLHSRGGRPTGFSVAGEDQVFHWASAEIVGKDTVLVSSPNVSKPVAVRYGWADNPVVTLYNSAQLPMCPFRTDDWPGMTDEQR